MKFTALDFETATGYRNSICQVGLVQYDNGIIVNELNLLVQPPDNYYWEKFIDIHGITPKDTIDRPTLDQVWQEIEPYIKDQNVVAHNGFGFDFQVLTKTLEHYRIPVPKFVGHCTYRIFGDNLKSLCTKYKIELKHHDALSDAKACGELFLNHLNK